MLIRPVLTKCQFWIECHGRWCRSFQISPSSLDEIEEIGSNLKQLTWTFGTKILAREVVTLVHYGEKAYKEALNITEQLFAEISKIFLSKSWNKGFGVPNYQVKADDNLNIVELLVTAGVIQRQTPEREDIQNGAIISMVNAFKTLTWINGHDKLKMN